MRWIFRAMGLAWTTCAACVGQTANKAPAGGDASPPSTTIASTESASSSVVVASMPPLESLPFQHGAPVAALDWSPDGTMIVASDLHGFVRVFATQDGRPIADLPRGRLGLPPVARFSPDGSRIAVGYRDIVVYAVTSHEGDEPSAWSPVTTLARGDVANPVEDLVWSPDGRKIASHMRGDPDGQVLAIWDVGKGSRHDLPDVERFAHATSLSIVFLDDQHLVATWGSLARLVEGRRGATQHTWTLPSEPLSLALWGGRAMVVGHSGFFVLDPGLDVPTPLDAMGRGLSSRSLLSISGDLVALGSVAGRMTIEDEDGFAVARLPGGETLGTTALPGVAWDDSDARSRVVALDHDGKRIAYGSFTRVGIRRVPSLELAVPESAAHQRGPTALTWSPDGRVIASVDSHVVCTWMREGSGPRWCTELDRTQSTTDPPQDLRWTGQAQLIVTARDWAATVDASTGRIVEYSSAGSSRDPERVPTVTSPDGTCTVDLTSSDTIPAPDRVVIEATCGERRESVDVTEALRHPPHVAAFSADGRWLVLGTPDTRIHVVDAARWLGRDAD